MKTAQLARTLVALALSLSVSAVAYARTEVCKDTNEQEIAGLFERWNQSLQSGDPVKVVDNYAEHSMLLATVSNQPRVSVAEKIDYFAHFLPKKPVGSVDPGSRMIEIDCNSAFDTGLYSFKLGDGSTLHARYTFTYQWDGTSWLITSHHSSFMPQRN
jgi:hypothetical protein